MDVAIVVFKTFQSIQIDGSFGFSKMVSEILHKGFLTPECSAQHADVIFSSLLLETDSIDEAIDDLSGCHGISGMGGQGHKGRMRGDMGSGL